MNNLEALDRIKTAYDVVVAGKMETRQQLADFREASTLLLTALPALVEACKQVNGACFDYGFNALTARGVMVRVVPVEEIERVISDALTPLKDITPRPALKCE